METIAALVIRKTLAASCRRVFAAWTDPEMIKQWFAPSDAMTVPVAETDVRVGGEYLFVMRNSEGETYSPRGVYEEIIADRKLVFSWRWADSNVVTRVTVELQPTDDSATELTLTHERFADSAMQERHAEGWNACLSRLSALLA